MTWDQFCLKPESRLNSFSRCPILPMYYVWVSFFVSLFPTTLNLEKTITSMFKWQRNRNEWSSQRMWPEGRTEREIHKSVSERHKSTRTWGSVVEYQYQYHFFLKHFYKVPQPAHLSWKWCFYLELIFPNTVSVSMICSYRLLREMWSHRKNSDISMTFSAEREKEIISLSFVLFFFKFNEDLEMERKEGERAFCPQTGFS